MRLFGQNKHPQTEFNYPVYEGSDLGITYTPSGCSFKVWSPSSDAVRLHLYAAGEGGLPERTYDLLPDKSSGLWQTQISGDQKGRYYTIQIQRPNIGWIDETPDPYAKAVGVNGRRAQIVDPSDTDPAGWDQDKRPDLIHPTDIVLYELHVRDFSSNANSGLKNKGKYLAFTETGSRSPEGESTGIDHLMDLGITHVHLLPVFDYRSVDESRPADGQYNWGYDPENYNTPEGSYATNATDGAVRIREFKQMVLSLHQNGIRVVMDVVYNHTGATGGSVFERTVPGYYYRQRPDGSYSDASACGNETASERPMVRKYIVESVLYWAREYHIDGFRFDLMGIHDIETMNAVTTALHEFDPTIFVYGEGWTAGSSPLPDEQRALKANVARLDATAAFSDDIRDGLRGHVFTHTDPGFASGKPGLAESIKFGIVASTQHPQVDYSKVKYSQKPWAREPWQTITYVSCHDNHTLWDRLAVTNPTASESDRIRMHKLAHAVVFTSQGVAFMHAGEEMLRTKHGVENSYNAPDSINWLDWSRKMEYNDVYTYTKGLITLRKNHPAFRMTSAAMIRDHLEFLPAYGSDDHAVSYLLKNNANGDSWKTILVIINGGPKGHYFKLPSGRWRIVLDENTIDENNLRYLSGEGTALPPISAMVLVKVE
ncbi:MAG: type I pullulanase [Saprospiraceae bacterium]|nr:type I pullulanase [Saprospiraceae bacterium]